MGTMGDIELVNDEVIFNHPVQLIYIRFVNITDTVE